MLSVHLFFDPIREDLSADGWVVATWNDQLEEPLITTNYYATLTAAKTAITSLFDLDSEVNAYFQGKAEANYLAANGAAVATAHLAQRSTEFLATGIQLGAGPGYLLPSGTTGWATTPDSAELLLPNEFTLVFKTRGPSGSGTALQTIAGQYEADPQRSWLLRRSETTGAFTWTVTPNGNAAQAVDRTVNGQAISASVVQYNAVSVRLNDGTNQVLSSWSSLDGTDWAQVATTQAATVGAHNSTGLLRVGGYSSSPQEPWDDRIHWVEMRTGTNPASGSILWRFDVADHSTGTTWTDPRGKVWTIGDASVVVHDGRLS